MALLADQEKPIITQPFKGKIYDLKNKFYLKK